MVLKVRLSALLFSLFCTVSAVLLTGCSNGGMAVQPPQGPTPGPNPVTGPAYTFSVASFSFGTVPVGSASAAQNVLVTSTGTTPLTISSFQATGDYYFSFGNCPSTPSTLAVGATCSLGVTFTPFASGARTGVVLLGTDTASTAPTLTLAGTGGTTGESVSTAALAFGTVALGSTSAAQTITISATGPDPLYLAGLQVTGDFARTSTTCAAPLATGSSCTVQVAFTPTQAGSRTGSLVIPSNASSGSQTVALTGNGVAAPNFAGPAFNISVRGGTLPLMRSSVQLYVAGNTGAGSAGGSLLSQPLLTDNNGLATVAGGYVCPTALSPVYAVANGGSVGSAGANGNVRLLTALGPCGALTQGATYSLNEATTVAAAYSLAQFYAGAASIGASATNLIGLTNAFSTAASLVDPLAGTSPGATLPATANSPAARIDTVANALNSCVAAAANCAALYAATTNGTSPGNTLDAVVSLARNPASNTAAVYALAQPSSGTASAYSPALTTAPADWTLFVTLTGGGLNSPAGIGVDSQGAVWVSNYFYSASKFSPVGTPVFAGGITGKGLNNSYGLGIDLNDNVWIPNEQPFTSTSIGSVTLLTPSGMSNSGASGFQLGGLNYPLSVALDPNGTTWVVDYGNSHVTQLNSQGTPVSGVAGYTTTLFAFPVAVAIDANHNGWIANQSSNTVTKVAADGSAFTNYTCCMGASGLAIDQGNNVWVANFYGDSVSLISNTGQVIGNATYTANGGISRPQAIAIDGAGNVWIANYRAAYLSELAGAGASVPGASLTPKTGFGADAALLEAYAISIDASGNLWVSNQGSNSVTKFIGLAAPVRTPLSLAPKAP